MLLAGSAILLGCAPGVGEAANALKEAVGQPHLGVGALRIGLLAAATYYGWGFLDEVFAAQRVNKDRMDASQLANYESEVRGFSKRLDTEAKSLEGIAEAVRKTTENLPARIEETLSLMIVPKEYLSAARTMSFSEQNSSRLNSQDPDIAAAAHAQMMNMYPEALEEARMEAARGIPQIADSISVWTAQLDNFMERLPGVIDAANRAAKRLSLNKNIYRHRWFSFWFWEVGASISIYLFAVLVTFTPLGFALGDAAGGWVSSPPSTQPFSPSS